MESPRHGGQPLAHYLGSGHPMAPGSLCARGRCVLAEHPASLLARRGIRRARCNFGISSIGIVPVDCRHRYDLLFRRVNMSLQKRTKKQVVRPKSPGKRRSSGLPGLRILVVMLGVPLLVLLYQAEEHTSE